MKNEEREKLKYIKQWLDWSKSFKTKTSDGWTPSIVGEFKNQDVEWMINTIEEQQDQLHRMYDENWELTEKMCGMVDELNLAKRKIRNLQLKENIKDG